MALKLLKKKVAKEMLRKVCSPFLPLPPRAGDLGQREAVPGERRARQEDREPQGRAEEAHQGERVQVRRGRGRDAGGTTNYLRPDGTFRLSRA